MTELTLIIPAKKEKESLPQVIEELKFIDSKKLIVLEESDTETINAIKEFDCQIVHQTGKGYGNALIEGMRRTKTKYFCIFNADGSFNPNELKKMIETIEKENKDFIFGSRYEKNAGSDDDTIVTLIGNFIFTFLGNLFFKLNISDILYTYIVGKTESVNKLNLVSQDFRLCVELPIKAKKNKMELKSIASYERKRIAGKKKVNALKDGFMILTCMIELLFKKS